VTGVSCAGDRAKRWRRATWPAAIGTAFLGAAGPPGPPAPANVVVEHNIRAARSSDPSKGDGRCYSKNSSKRLKYRRCNVDACPASGLESSVYNSQMGKYVSEKAYLKCNSGVDLALLLDVSGSMSSKLSDYGL